MFVSICSIWNHSRNWYIFEINDAAEFSPYIKLAEIDRNKLKEGYEEAKKWTEIKNKLTRDTNLYHQAEARLSEKRVEECESKVGLWLVTH